MKSIALAILALFSLSACTSSRKYLDGCYAVYPQQGSGSKGDLSAALRSYSERYSLSAAPARAYADEVYVESSSGIAVMLGHETLADNAQVVFLSSPARPCKRCSVLNGELMNTLSERFRVDDCPKSTLEELERAVQK